MAKRAPVDQKPFTALDKGLAASVLNPTPVVPELPAEASSEQGRGLAAVEAPPREPVMLEVPAEAPKAATSPRPAPVAARVQPKVAEPSYQEKLSREKRVLLTLSEEREIERCVDRIAEGFGGTPVKLSHVVRACLAVVRHAEGEIIRRAQDAEPLVRPPNGDVMALAEFEHALARVLSQAFRDAPAVR